MRLISLICKYLRKAYELKNCSQLNVHEQNVKLIVYYEHEASDYSSAMQMCVEGVDYEVRGYCSLIFCRKAARLLPGTALQTEEGQAGRMHDQ